MSALTTDVDVAIIGAGISGLAVARGVWAAGRSARVFEARPRAGGRILSTAVPGGQADLGATWFWPGERRIGLLVSELGLAVHEQFASGDALAVGNGAAHRLRGHSAGPAFRFSDGAHSLTSALAQELPADTIDFAAPVERIEQAAQGVVVHTAGGSTTAGQVVLALPPPLAVPGMVDPATLATVVADTAAQIPVWMGGITKAVAVYERAFWRDLGLSGTVSAPSDPFSEIHDMSGPDGSPAMLFGFGQAAGQHSPTADVFVRQLVDVFGSDAASPIAVVACDWSAELFTTRTRGSESERYDLYGSPLLRTPSWDGRLHWASTESGGVAPGHLEGALEAAERTVRMLTA